MNAKEPLEIAKPLHKEHCIACEMMEESKDESKESKMKVLKTFQLHHNTR